MKPIWLALACMALSACSSADSSGDEELTEDTEFAAPEEERGGETYSEYDERRDDLDGQMGSYAGDGCTEDCSGHEAGYQWAMDKGITDPNECGGKSWSFEEGCRAYAEEQRH